MHSRQWQGAGGEVKERPDSPLVGGSAGGAARCTPGEAAAAGRPPFLARNSALLEPAAAAAAAHTVPLLLLLLPALHTCVASCQAGFSFQSVGIILAGQQLSQR